MTIWKGPTFSKGMRFDPVNTPIPITDQGFPACGLLLFAFLCQPFLNFGFHFWIPGLELKKGVNILITTHWITITITITGTITTHWTAKDARSLQTLT